MLITPKRKYNKFGHLIELKDNGFVGCGMRDNYKKELQRQVASEILDDVKKRLSPEHIENCEERLIFGKNYKGESTGLRRFSAVENMDAFLRGVKCEKIPLLLTITKTEVTFDQINFNGIEHVLFRYNGERFIVTKDSDPNLPCIQITANSQLKNVVKGDFEGHINNISQNLEYYLVKASFEVSLANEEKIPEFLIESITEKKILQDLVNIQSKEERILNEEKYNTNIMLFAINHMRCTSINNALKRSEITIDSAKLHSKLAPTKLVNELTTDPYKIFKQIPKIIIGFNHD